jgi:hypothetical protein
LLRDRRGNAAVLAAVFFPMLIGAAGLAVDTVQWVLEKRQLQQAADGASMAGVYGLIVSQDVQSAVSDSLTRGGQLPAGNSIEAVQSPPGHETDPFAVRVTLSAPAKLSFSSLFIRRPWLITANSTASVVEGGTFCAFALGPIDDPGVIIRPNSDVEMDCSIATNSSSPRALLADASSKLTAASIMAFGGIDGGGAIKDSPARTHALQQNDPLENTEPPLVPDTGCPNITVNPDAASTRAGKVTLEPGCYGNMTLNGPVHLQDGEYILNRGDFSVGPQGNVSCDACTIYLTSDAREGPNAGILIYQDRHAARDLPGDENRIGGDSFSKLEGLIYFPSEAIYLDGTMRPDLQCARVIGRRLMFAGQVYVAKKCDGLDHVTFAATMVRLID